MAQKYIVKDIIKNKFTLIYLGRNLHTYKHNTTSEYVTKYVNDNKYWVGKDTCDMYDLTTEEFIKKFD